MDLTNIIWGAVVVGTGIFLTVYGAMLFKFALAAMGFGIGFMGAVWLLDGQSDTVRILVSMVVGAVVGIVLYTLVRFSMYIAGAILGSVIALAISGFIDILGPKPGNIVQIILLVGGLAGGVFLGPRLGTLVVVLATAAAGAFMVIYGVQIWFSSEFESEISDPSGTVDQRLTLVVFLIVFGISFLGQLNSQKLRDRVLN